MTQPIQLIAEIYAVEVPEGAANFELDTPDWQIICTTKEVNERQAKGIVGSSEWFFPARHTRYIDYKFPYDRENKQRWSEGFGTAIESLRSLVTSKGLNPESNYLIIKKVS